MAWADGLQSLTSSRVNGNRGSGAPRTGNQYKLGVRRDEQKLEICLVGWRETRGGQTVSSGLSGLCCCVPLSKAVPPTAGR